MIRNTFAALALCCVIVFGVGCGRSNVHKINDLSSINDSQDDCIEPSLTETDKIVTTQATSDGVVSTTEKSPLDGMDTYVHSTNYYIQVNPIYQEPELPAGCEITTLTALLNYLGYSIDKVSLCDEFLPIDLTCTKTFNEAYIGNPKDDTGFGCYSPVIVKTAQDYLSSVKSQQSAVNISGCSFQQLFMQIEKNRPVIVWTSIGLVDIREYYCWTSPSGEEARWIENEHCVLLTGFDYNNSTVTVCDSLEGERQYSMELFEYRFNQLGNQAVIIY